MEGMDILILAGMPIYRLSDVAQARLESISFFLFGFLICAILFKLVWNVLAKEIGVLPRLSFKASLAALLVSGLFRNPPRSGRDMVARVQGREAAAAPGYVQT